MPDMGSNDKLLSSIMQKSKLTMPFSDFEDKVMQRITKETIRKGAVLKNIKLSSLFFLLPELPGDSRLQQQQVP